MCKTWAKCIWNCMLLETCLHHCDITAKSWKLKNFSTETLRKGFSRATFAKVIWVKAKHRENVLVLHSGWDPALEAQTNHTRRAESKTPVEIDKDNCPNHAKGGITQTSYKHAVVDAPKNPSNTATPQTATEWLGRLPVTTEENESIPIVFGVRCFAKRFNCMLKTYIRGHSRRD